MQQFLLSGRFDSFELVSAQVTTFCTFKIDGSFLPGYLPAESSEEPESSEFAPWKEIRSHVLALVRGTSKPYSMRFVLRLSRENTEKVLENTGSSLSPDDIGGLYLNISYSRGAKDTLPEETITCVTGTSLKTFSPDKRLEHQWDDLAMKFFRKAGIPVSEMC